MISSISSSSSYLLEEEFIEEPLSKERKLDKKAKKILALNASFYKKYDKLTQDAEKILDHLSDIHVEDRFFQEKRKMTKEAFFQNVCKFAKKMKEVSWPPKNLKVKGVSVPSPFRQLRITTFDTLSILLDYHLEKEEQERKGAHLEQQILIALNCSH